jgi:hypothetical protein
VISDNIVEQFSGKIGCKSRFNHGSTFMFSILLGKDEDYIDKRKLDDELKTGSNFAVSAPFVSDERQHKG